MPSADRSRNASSGRSGLRSLLLVLAVVAAAALGTALALVLPALLAPGLPVVEGAIERAQESRCMGRLREVYKGLLQYEVERGSLPPGGGAALVTAALEERAARGEDAPPPAEYLGRDTERFPLERFPADGDEPLVACDAHARDDHPEVVHVLYGDGRIRSFRFADVRRRGEEPLEDGELRLGPGAPIADLRKLTRE